MSRLLATKINHLLAAFVIPDEDLLFEVETSWNYFFWSLKLTIRVYQLISMYNFQLIQVVKMNLIHTNKAYTCIE